MNYQIHHSQAPNSPFSILEKSERSTVKLLTNSGSSQKYAVKYVSAEKRLLQREFDILAKFNHSNIIKAVETGTEGKSEYLVTEFMDQGDLLKFTLANKDKIYDPWFIKDKMREIFYRSVFIQCLRGVLEVHRLGWAHLDLKPENYVINSDFEVKIIDFEFAFEMDQLNNNRKQCSKYCGSESYFPPEILDGKAKTPYNPMKCDVFSLAAMMVSLMSGSNVFGTNFGSPNYQYRRVKCGDFNAFWAKVKNSEFFSAEFKDLMEKMLAYEPEQRLSCLEAERHQWFQGETFTTKEIKELFEKIELKRTENNGAHKDQPLRKKIKRE